MLVPQGLSHALFGPGLAASRGLSAGAAFRLETGRLGGAPFGWALLVAAAVPLLIGRGWRLSWAIRCWAVILVSVGFVSLAGRGWLGLPVPTPEVFLAPAAIGIAWSIALGFIAFRVDLREFRFGLPQVAAGVATVAFALASLPIVAAAGDGNWGLEAETFARDLSYIERSGNTGDFRVLWVGDPEALPVDSWRIASGLSYGTSRNGVATLTDLWAPNRPGSSVALGDALKVALNGRTTRLGHLLGPMGVRYVIVPSRVAPKQAGRVATPPARDIAGAMGEQVDFRQLDATADVSIFENAAWVPLRAVLTKGQATSVATAGGGFAGASANDIGGAKPALPDRASDYSFSGPLSSGTSLFFAETPSPRWRLSVDGKNADRSRAFGFSTTYSVDNTGKASLRYRTSPLRYLTLLLEIAVWVIVIRGAWNWRRSSRGEVA
jgi:hypothetical protein